MCWPAAYLLVLGEMLLQSHNGILRLFLALAEYKDASFADLRAEGPTLVPAQRAGGEVTDVRLKALADVTWKIKNPWTGVQLWLRRGKSGEQELLGAKTYIEMSLAAGGEVTLAPRRENLSGVGLIRPRAGEEARARLMTFDDGMLVWLGKPASSEYYAALEAASAGAPWHVDRQKERREHLPPYTRVEH